MRVRLENMKINCRLKPNPAAISKGWAMGFGGKTIALHLPYVSVCNFHFMFGRKNAGTAIKCTHTWDTGNILVPGSSGVRSDGRGPRTIRWKGPLNATKWIYLPDREREFEGAAHRKWKGGPARNVNILWVNKAQNEIYATWPTTDKSEPRAQVLKCRTLPSNAHLLFSSSRNLHNPHGHHPPFFDPSPLG